nr:hypothetical protein [Tanacetum cinerariifolium]
MMEDLLQAPTKGVGYAIIVLAVLANQFELKIGLHNLVTAISFHGFENDDPHSHIRSETFSEAWERFKDLLKKCLHHGFLPLHQLDTFYNGLNQSDQDSFNFATGGKLLTRNTQEALTIIENKSKVRTSRNKPQVSSSIGSSSQNDTITALTKQVEALGKHIDAMQKPVHSIHESCATYGGTHHYSKCQATGSFTQGDVYAATRNYNTGVPPTPKEEMEKEPETLMDEQLYFVISLVDALTQILKYSKVLKDLLKDKEKLEELANTPINAECSSILLNKVPEKLGDTGKFLIPCVLQDLEVCNSLANSRASINLMPLSINEKLGIGPLKPTQMTLELANQSITYPIGRPFLHTTKALVDIYKEKLTLRIKNEELVFRVEKALRYPSKYHHFVHSIDIVNSSFDNDFIQDEPRSGSTTSHYDSLKGSSSPSLALFETSDSLLEEFAIELALINSFPSRNDDIDFDFEYDLRELE